MVVTVLRAGFQPERAASYAEVAVRMRTLTEGTPGLVSFRTFRADEGERVSIIDFESEEALQSGREHPEHRKARELERG
jgi:heme-degrading monooxygenase HmoA